MLGAGTDPTSAADCVCKTLVVPHLGETQSPLSTHAYHQSPTTGIRLLDVNDLRGANMGRQESQCTGSGAAAAESKIVIYLSHWNDDVALAAILTGKTKVVLGQADLAKSVKMTE